jgi:peptidoglycan/xylan/chitin deacetylase (PgdA/CDA1 family)
MIGEAAQRHPDLVRQVAQAGHAIGNHSWDHPCFLSLSGRERRKQIDDCRRAIAPYGCRLFRPPYGDQNLASRLDALWMRHRVVTWSIDTKDWLNRAPEEMVDKILAEIQPGCIILFHDGSERRGDQSPDRSRTLRAVSLLFARLGGAFSFVTIPQLLRSSRPRLRLWFTENDPVRVARLNRVG